MYEKFINGSIYIPLTNRMVGVADITPPPRIVLDLLPIKDSFVREGAKILNYGKNNTMLVGYGLGFGATEYERYRSFIGFDLSSIPTKNIEIELAELRLYNTRPKDRDNQIGIYYTNGYWDELGITWLNQPIEDEYITQFSIGTRREYVSINLTDYIKNSHSSGNFNISFILKAIDEVFDQYVEIGTKESADTKPYLHIVYRDDNIQSVGRSPLPSTIYVRGIDSQHFPASIEIQKIIIDENAILGSSIEVENPRLMKSSIVVGRPEIKSSIGVVRVEESKISSSIVILNEWRKEFGANIIVNTPIKKASIYIPYSSILPSTLYARAIRSQEIKGNLIVSTPNKKASIYIPYKSTLRSSLIVSRDKEEDFPGHIIVSRDKTKSSITVYQSDDSKISGSLIFVKSDDESLKGYLTVTKDRLKASIRVVRTSSIPGSIVYVKENSDKLKSTISIPHRKYILSSIDVQHWSELPSSIQVHANHLKSSIVIAESSPLPVTMEVLTFWGKALPSSIIVGESEVDWGYVIII